MTPEQVHELTKIVAAIVRLLTPVLLDEVESLRGEVERLRRVRDAALAQVREILRDHVATTEQS